MDWYAVLARGSDELLEYVTFDLDSSGEGVAEIALDGEEDVFWWCRRWMRMLRDTIHNWNSADDYSYDWEAELIIGSSDGDGGEDGDGDQGGTDLSSDGMDDESFSVFGSCGCSAGTVGGGLTMAWLMGIMGMIRRRSAD